MFSIDYIQEKVGFRTEEKQKIILERYQLVTVHYERPAFYNFLLGFRINFDRAFISIVTGLL
jgi:hypothetical protein